MVQPAVASDSARGDNRPAGKRTARRVLNTRILVGSLVALTVLATACYFWRAYQLRRTSSVLAERAETLAEEKHFAAAAHYYARYLELSPEDADARLRRAELSEKAARGSAGLLAVVELYQEALAPARQGLAPAKQLTARRRLTELLLQGDRFAAAESEVEKLRELERGELADKPEQWRWPGLKALALAGKFRGNGSAVPRATLEEAFGEVLDPEKSGKPKVFKDPGVYLARYEYRLQQNLPNAGEDLDAAVQLGPANPAVLLTAAIASQREAAAVARAGSREKARESYSKACGYYERVIDVAPSDRRAYERLGQLYGSLGDLQLAIQTWRRGLKEVNPEGDRVGLNIYLAEALLQQRRLPEAESVLTTLDRIVATLDPKAKLSLQRSVDLRRAKLLLLSGRYADAISLVTDLAAGKEVVQGGAGMMEPHMLYEAWMILGQSHAALTRWDPALAAFEQAALLEPREASPRLAAAEACKAAGRRDAAITSYQRALAIVNAMKPPPEAQQQAIYEQLISVLEEQKRRTEADRYRALHSEQMAQSARLTLQGAGLAIRDGKLEEALAIARRGVESRPADPWAYVALGRVQRAKKDSDKAEDAYRKAVEVAKGEPQVQMAVAGFLLASTDGDDRLEAERVLRGLVVQHAPACLQLVGLLAKRGKAEEAIEVARQGIRSQPKHVLAHIALGVALWANKNDDQAEAAFKNACRLAPADVRPLSSLLDFYAGTNQTERARETLEKVAKNTAIEEVDRAVLVAEGYGRLGDRPRAKDAYQKAIKAAKGDPAVEMRLAEFLLHGNDRDEAVEGERMLRDLMGRHDPARRRLAEVLLARGGEQEWEEAQHLLESSVGGPTSGDDRLLHVVTLARRGGHENLAKAERICQGWLADVQQPQPAARLLLAIVQERQGKLEEARKQYQALVAEPRPALQAILRYVDFLLTRGPPAEADKWLRKLEHLAPEDFSALELRARWLRGQGRVAEIDPLVESAAETLQKRIGKEDSRQQAQLCRAVGDLYDRLARYSAAERWYRRLVKLEPDGYGALATSLAKQGRTQEAVALCDEAGKGAKSAQSALTLAGVLLSGRATTEDLKQAEPSLRKAMEMYKDDIVLLANVANVRILQGRADEAIEIYRQILQRQPRRPEVLNNLATLLSERPEPEIRKEAMEHIEQAIELSGPQPGWLDTKGLLLGYEGKPEQAVGLLEEAASVPHADPRWLFHLAVAQARLGDLEKAGAALQQARDGELDHQLLTAMDRQLLADLEKKLGQRARTTNPARP